MKLITLQEQAQTLEKLSTARQLKLCTVLIRALLARENVDMLQEGRVIHDRLWEGTMFYGQSSELEIIVQIHLGSLQITR